MIIEYLLQGSKMKHQGILDTTGFSINFATDYLDEDNFGSPTAITGYKIYSHGSFAFYHEDYDVAALVYSKLISVLRGANNVDIGEVGYFRRLNK